MKNCYFKNTQERTIISGAGGGGGYIFLSYPTSSVHLHLGVVIDPVEGEGSRICYHGSKDGGHPKQTFFYVKKNIDRNKAMYYLGQVELLLASELEVGLSGLLRNLITQLKKKIWAKNLY